MRRFRVLPWKGGSPDIYPIRSFVTVTIDFASLHCLRVVLLVAVLDTPHIYTFAMTMQEHVDKSTTDIPVSQR